MPQRLTPTVKILLIGCLGMFLVQHTLDQFFSGNVTGTLGLVPAGFVSQFKFWQIFTYPFLHGDVFHLLLNLLMLAFVGVDLEAAWGPKRFVRFYFICSTVAGIFYLLLQIFIWKESGMHQPLVGASGAIYGLLMAYGLIYGERVMLFMMLIPMKAKHFVWILAGVEFMSSVFSGRGGIASVAHLGGMFAGFVVLFAEASWILSQKRKKSGPSGSSGGGRSRKKSSHLKLVVDKDEPPKDRKWNRPQDFDKDDGPPRTWN